VAEMRFLTVRQPWAGCIAHLGKRVENRGWHCPARSVGTQIAIHAAAAVDDAVISVPGGEDWASLFASRAEWDAWRFWYLGQRPRDVANWPPKLARRPGRLDDVAWRVPGLLRLRPGAAPAGLARRCRPLPGRPGLRPPHG
jgi:hypothetical protein